MDQSVTLHLLAYVGLLLLLSYAGGKMANHFSFPRVTGYLVAGIILGPSVSGLFPASVVREDLSIVTQLALAVIAFSVGGSLHLGQLKTLGRQILWTTLTEAVGAFILTAAVLAGILPLLQGVGYSSPEFISRYLPLALIIGGLCAATAPAAVLAIVHEYRARGPLTSVLLGVVALDDALAVIFTSLTLEFFGNHAHLTDLTWRNSLLSPLWDIASALLLGLGLALALSGLFRFVTRRESLLSVALGTALLTGGLAVTFHVPFLLACMALGFGVANFVHRQEELFSAVEGIEEPLFGAFFLLAGAHLDFGAIKVAGIISLLITVGRLSGKLVGTQCGLYISGASATVRKYLGLALLPQAGVAIGLVLEARSVLGVSPWTEIMVSGVLGAVIINELIAPPLVRYSLLKAGEATVED